MPKRIALVDADGILFSAALSGQTTCDGEVIQLTTIDEVYKNALKRMAEQTEVAGCDETFLALSDRNNFRKDIFPAYKAQRKVSERPLLLDELRARISDDQPHKVWLIKNLEADDVCGIAAGTLRSAGNYVVIVSPDKDLLQIPGEVLQWMPTNSGTKGKRQVVRRTTREADMFHAYQTLAGDVVDNYKGCPGMGPVKAKKLLDRLDEKGCSMAEVWEAVLAEFDARGLTGEDCLVQARVSRILRLTDWDRVAKVPLLFNFPTK